MITEELINLYLKDQLNKWADTTVVSVRHKLYASRHAINGDPSKLWRHCEVHLQPYSRVTLFVLVTGFWDWLHPNKQNPYKVWKNQNAKRFKYSYERSPATLSYSEAKFKISQIPAGPARDRAAFILNTGARWCESGVSKSYTVIGKGRKKRTLVPLERGISNSEVSYRTLLRTLSKVGLTTHDLRKIYATELARRGATMYEICRIMGWNSIDTALCYIGLTNDRIETLREAI